MESLVELSLSSAGVVAESARPYGRQIAAAQADVLQGGGIQMLKPVLTPMTAARAEQVAEPTSRQLQQSAAGAPGRQGRAGIERV